MTITDPASPQPSASGGHCGWVFVNRFIRSFSGNLGPGLLTGWLRFIEFHFALLFSNLVRSKILILDPGTP